METLSTALQQAPRQQIYDLLLQKRKKQMLPTFLYFNVHSVDSSTK